VLLRLSLLNKGRRVCLLILSKSLSQGVTALSDWTASMVALSEQAAAVEQRAKVHEQAGRTRLANLVYKEYSRFMQCQKELAARVPGVRCLRNTSLKLCRPRACTETRTNKDRFDT
jgi:hypothetical protein